ncbi:hypothetical protein D3C79_945380 [compost metagenome]
MFSDDLDDHNSAVREFQLKRRADYRSSPAPQAQPAASEAVEPDASEAQQPAEQPEPDEASAPASDPAPADAPTPDEQH